MRQNKCKCCKYYKEGLNIDYVPSYWCKLNNFKNAETCEHYKEEYTINDYILDILPTLIVFAIIAMFILICNMCK